MKKKIFNTLLVSILLINLGCKPEVCADCVPFTFKETYLKYFQDDDFFLIKGEALDIKKHGRNIKVIEDLKGNFTNKSSVFVWGGSSTSFCGKGRLDMRGDDITQYHKNDTLIMFITTNSTKYNRNIEKIGDYATLGCYPSVLKLSDGYVTGIIDLYTETMLWSELQEELQILNKK